MERSLSQENQSLSTRSLLEINSVPYEDVATVTSRRRACSDRDDETKCEPQLKLGAGSHLWGSNIEIPGLTCRFSCLCWVMRRSGTR
jgi:hypothetical protein